VPGDAPPEPAGAEDDGGFLLLGDRARGSLDSRELNDISSYISNVGGHILGSLNGCTRPIGQSGRGEERMIRSRLGFADYRGIRRKAIVGAVCAASVVGVAACGGGGDDNGGGGGTVVFGANTELSGPYQIYGLPAEQGARLAASAINDDGGVKAGDESFDMEVATEDNRSDPSQIVSAARAVVDDGAIAALGPDLGAVPSYNVFKQNDVITFTPAFDLQLTLLQDPQGNPLLFSPTVFLAELYTTNMKQLKALYPDIKSVAILSPNDEQGQGTAAAYEAAAKAEGLDVVDVQTYSPGNTDFTSVLTSFKQESPDLLVAEQTPEQGRAILQQAAQLEVAPYALNDTMTPDQALDVPGIEKIKVILPSFAPTFSPAATIPDYSPEEIFGDEEPAGTPGAAIDMYYAVRMLAQAMEEAGTVTDSAAIAEALPGQSYDGPFGKCTMSQRKEVNCETLVFAVEGGSTVTVYRFPSPDAVQPSDTYICKQSNCEAQ
jgi:branched-chain amino acid transport system substrate-binding protein